MRPLGKLLPWNEFRSPDGGDWFDQARIMQRGFLDRLLWTIETSKEDPKLSADDVSDVIAHACQWMLS